MDFLSGLGTFMGGVAFVGILGLVAFAIATFIKTRRNPGAWSAARDQFNARRRNRK